MLVVVYTNEGLAPCSLLDSPPPHLVIPARRNGSLFWVVSYRVEAPLTQGMFASTYDSDISLSAILPTSILSPWSNLKPRELPNGGPI